ncbi:MAG TPA: M23 family metallopeptidase [Thermoanaerobaculia bacterium]|jgi:murein DD-endopeptidase MepM/ murein hydrolase activator NlpD|nr:M23 family metallopeptidase [Thermoanaerobaculia bacterium]
MIPLFLAALVFTAHQGTAVQVKVPNEPGVKSVEVMWQTKAVPAFRAGDDWATFLGVDLDAKPGEHTAEAVVTRDDGRVERREITVDILAKSYPTEPLKVAGKFVEPSKADLARSQRENKEVGAIYRRITNEIVPDEPFTVPIPDEAGTNFGVRRVFNGEPRAPHSGADLHAAAGTPVHATNRGRVVVAKKLFFTGNTVIVDHGLGIYSLYAHLSRIDVKEGEVVRNGQLVGLSGATGRVTAPHLHWAMRVQDARVDPFSLIGSGSH